MIEELAASLRSAGVRAVFGVPGSGPSWQLLTALEQQGAPFHSVAHEGGAAIMAGAYARQSGTLGCSLSIKGPGVANAVPGIVSNAYEHWPALSIAEAYPTGGPAERMHKRLDQRALLAPVVKRFASLGAADPVRALAAAAFREMPGPVHLDLAPGPDEPASGAAESSRDPRGGMAAIERAHRPVIIAGSLAVRQKLGSALARLRVPVFTTLAAKGVLDERAPYAAGVFTGDGRSLAPESRILKDADLIVGIGLRNLEILTPAPFAAGLVAVDTIDATPWLRGLAPSHVLTLPEDAGFDELMALLGAREWGLDLVGDAVSAARAYLTRDETLPGHLFAAMQSALINATLVADTGAFCTVAEHVWTAASPDGFVASANGRFMGTSIPMALGAALAARAESLHRRAPVVCAMGDGGVRPSFSEIKLAVEEKLPIVFLLISDGRYGSIVAGASKPGLSARAVTFANPSWLRAAESIGCSAARVAGPDDALRALQHWTSADGPLFLEAHFDPDPYVHMTKDIR